MFARHAVIVTAAGSSQRFNNNPTEYIKKEFQKIGDRSVLYRSVSPFFEVPGLAAVFVTYRHGAFESTKQSLGDLNDREIPIIYVEGGKTRQESVFNALKALFGKNEEIKAELVSIHDGARPFVTKDTIMDCLAYAQLFGAAVPGIKINDTTVNVDDEGFIGSYIDRTNAYCLQTPQTFLFPDIFDAHVASIKEGIEGSTDDTQIYIKYGRKVAVVKGDVNNRKITYASDLEASK